MGSNNTITCHTYTADCCERLQRLAESEVNQNARPFYTSPIVTQVNQERREHFQSIYGAQLPAEQALNENTKD